MTTTTTTTWPPWATLRAEEVRGKLPPGKRGLWEEAGGMCVSKTSLSSTTTHIEHEAEEPYFFHCTDHMTLSQQGKKQRKPSPVRDQGLCVSC